MTSQDFKALLEVFDKIANALEEIRFNTKHFDRLTELIDAVDGLASPLRRIAGELEEKAEREAPGRAEECE